MLAYLSRLVGVVRTVSGNPGLLRVELAFVGFNVAEWATWVSHPGLRLRGRRRGRHQGGPGPGPAVGGERGKGRSSTMRFITIWPALIGGWAALLVAGSALAGRAGLGTLLTAAFILQVTPSIWTA